MKKKYYSLVCVLIFLVLRIFSFADEEKTAKEYFTRAEDKYIADDLEGAVADFEKGLALDPKNSSARGFYGLCLNTLVLRYYDKKDYARTLPYLEKLNMIFPGNQETKTMYEETKKHMAPFEKEIDNLSSLLKEQIKKQRELISEERGIRKLSQEMVLAQAEKERDKLLSLFSEREEKILAAVSDEGKKNRKNYFLLAGKVVLTMGGLILFLVFVSHKYSRRRELLLQNYEEKILTQLKNYLPGSVENKSSPGNGKTPGLLSVTDPQGRFHGVEIIEAEFSEKEKEIGERLLTPFLYDEDLKVKIRATWALIKFDKKKSLERLKQMSQDSDKSVRLKVAEVLSLIPQAQAFNLLFDMRTDPDEEVKREVIKYVHAMYAEKRVKLGKDLKEMVEKYLAEVRKELVID